MKNLLFVIFFSISPFAGYSQDYGNDSDELELCSVLQLNNFGTDLVAEEALDKILSAIGASKRFVLRPCDNINNAAAVSYKGIRYILYDRDFMSSITDGNNWGNLFILAHEVGHHINGHALDLILYATEVIKPETLEESRQDELEADEFAGFILARLDGSISEANKIINEISSNNDDSYSTHPSKDKRLKAVKRGFDRASYILEKPSSKEGIALEYMYSGWDKKDIGDYEGAIKDFTVSIELNDNLESALAGRGVCYLALEEYSKSVVDLVKANAINPIYGIQLFSAYLSLGYDDCDLARVSDDSKKKQALAKLGLYELKIALFIAELNIDNGLAKDDEQLAMAYYYYGFWKWNLEDWESGCNDITTAISLGWGNVYGFELIKAVKNNLKRYPCK